MYLIIYCKLSFIGDNLLFCLSNRRHKTANGIGGYNDIFLRKWLSTVEKIIAIHWFWLKFLRLYFFLVSISE